MPYKFDKTAFKINTFEEASNQTAYWRTKSPVERIKAATYLSLIAWNLDPENPPKMDRTAFKMRKRVQ
ncbi:MAG: hypothetical protein IPI60_20175 [Saprospiraceae bacterium]|nr:hypothetical protein [Saprospiraceae bacterium]